MKNTITGPRAAEFTAGILIAALVWMPTSAFAQKKEDLPETHDGLVLVPDRKVAAAYADPEADFSVYNKIMLLDCYVAFKKDWQRDQNRSRTSARITAEDTEKIKAEVAKLFREVFTEVLEGDGGYEVVDAAGDDVLLIRPAIIDLDITAPDKPTAGRSRTYTSTSGAATVYIELFDSVSGDILARAADRKEARRAGGYISYTNRVTNTADARRTLKTWANILRTRLDEIHGKAS